MGLLINADDFVGFHAIATSAAIEDVIDAYIAKFEQKFIRQLLGPTLGNLFIADLANTTQAPRFAVIEDAFSIQDNDVLVPVVMSPTEQNYGKIYESEGMKEMLLSMIYFEYVSDRQVRQGQAGTAKSNVDTANVVGFQAAQRSAEKKWNDAIETSESIQWYCSIYKPADYPEFMGIAFEPEYSSLL